MYANRYDRSPASRSLSAGAALLINGGLIAGLWFAAPELPSIIDVGPLETHNVPIDPPPPVEPEVKPEARQTVETRTTPPIHQPDPRVITPKSGPLLGTTPERFELSNDPPFGPAGTGGGTAEPPIAPPVLVDASVDQRYASSFQPDYPGSELRQGQEGVVKVRVLIGVDGRIKAVEQVSSATPGFFEATRRHALNKWRFKPATRDGIPVESWKVMSVRFRIDS